MKPGKYGVPKPLYFPFLPSYWTGKPRAQRVNNSEVSHLSPSYICQFAVDVFHCLFLLVQNIEMQEQSIGTNGNSKAHEEEPRDLEVGISIRGLTKVYNEVRQKENRLLRNKGFISLLKDTAFCYASCWLLRESIGSHTQRLMYLIGLPCTYVCMYEHIHLHVYLDLVIGY